MGIQDKIARSVAKTQRKLFGKQLQVIGSNANSTMAISIDEDKYGDQDIVLTDVKKVFVFIDWPGNEIPITNTGDSNTSSDIFHFYDALPIECYTRFEDNMKLGDIILHKIKLGDNNYQVLSLQLTDAIGNATVSDLVWKKWIVTFYTLQLDIYPEIELEIEKFRTTDTW